MRKILVVQERNSLTEKEIRRQFEEEITAGKTEITFIRPDELFTVVAEHDKEYCCVKCEFDDFRIFAIPPCCSCKTPPFQFLAILRQHYRSRKVIAVVYNDFDSQEPEIREVLSSLHYKPDFLCANNNLKTELDKRFGWMGRYG